MDHREKKNTGISFQISTGSDQKTCTMLSILWGKIKRAGDQKEKNSPLPCSWSCSEDSVVTMGSDCRWGGPRCLQSRVLGTCMNRMEPSLTAKSGFPSRGNVGRRQKRQTQVTRLSCLAQPVTRMGGRLVLKCRQKEGKHLPRRWKTGDARPARGARLWGVLKHHDGVTCTPVIGVFPPLHILTNRQQKSWFVGFFFPHCRPMIHVCWAGYPNCHVHGQYAVMTG